MQKESFTWVVTADGHKARIFEKTTGTKSNISLTHQLEADTDFAHEKPGRSFDSFGKGKHSVEPHSDPRDVEKQHFAENIAKILNDDANHNKFDKLIIIASPKMLGILSKILSKPVESKLILKLDKNITDLKTHEVEEYLVKHAMSLL